MKSPVEESLTQLFASLEKAAARKKVYSLKATRNGRLDRAHLLRVISASETVQARRLLKTLRGKIDTSEGYLATIFEHELPLLIEEYSRNIEMSRDAGSISMDHALKQLRAAALRLRSFYATDKHELRQEKSIQYFVCQFCGYVSEDSPPNVCPICRAKKEGFHEVF